MNSSNNTGERIVVLASHFMASEKQAAVAATPSDADAPTMYDSSLSSLCFLFLGVPFFMGYYYLVSQNALFFHSMF